MQKILSTIIKAAKLITVEPYTFFFFFAFSLQLVSYQSLLMDRACLATYSHEICRDLTNHTKAEKQSINDGNDLYMGVSLLGGLPAVVVAIFLGPWSDKYTRKYPLIFSSVGMCLFFTATTVISVFPMASPLLYVAAAAFSGFCGGYITIMSAACSYLSDVTDERSRPTRFAVLEFFDLTAIVLGSVVGGQIFSAFGYTAVMGVASVSQVCGTLWAIFMVKETKPKIQEGKICDMFRDLFTVSNIKECYKTFSRKRPGNLRMQIYFLAWAYFSLAFTDMGVVAINFPYAKQMYKWDVTEFSNIITGFHVMTAFFTITVVPVLSKRLTLHEAAIGFIGVLSMMAKMVVTSVAFDEGSYYFGWSCGVLTYSISIACRSRLSKVVDKEEIGRAFSLLSTCESVAPILGSVVFLQILNSAPDSFIGLPFAVAAVLLIPSAVMFWWMMSMPTISVEDYGKDEEYKKSRPLEVLSSYSTLHKEKF